MSEISGSNYSNIALSSASCAFLSGYAAHRVFKTLSACKADIAEFAEGAADKTFRQINVADWGKYGINSRRWHSADGFELLDPNKERELYSDALRHTKKILTRYLVISSIVAGLAAIVAGYSVYKANQ